ncbi:hypothetical protein [Cellulomonas sp. SG140]|uniref:DUF7455 domain-containing protein n=1 Tax=Cellulomonas sp. SG140 TaxID=2976536 RepID=UPI0021E842A6|nr:hypothetical protein [Cellulomonas sp. SG140]
METTESELETFTPCDRCGHRAYVLVEAYSHKFCQDLRIALCGHHYRTFERQLTRQGFDVVEDRREELVPKREAVAA